MVTETITGTGAGMATGAGTGNVFHPSNAGYPLLVTDKVREWFLGCYSWVPLPTHRLAC
jgi:hypothetical protein